MKWRAVLVGCLLVLAGCSEPRIVGVGADADVTPTGNGTYDATVAVEVSGPPAAVESYNGSVVVTGVGPDGERFCRATFEDVDEGTESERVRCAALPLAFTVDAADYEGEEGDVFVSATEGLALTNVNESGSTYRTAGGESPVGYAQCSLRRNEVAAAVFGYPAPWTNWTRLSPERRTTHEITVENRTGEDVTNGVRGPALDPTPLPEDNATRPIREAIVEERGGGDVELASDAELTKERLLAAHGALLDRNVTDLDDLTGISTAGPPAHAAGAYTEPDGPTVSCAEQTKGTYEGGRLVQVTYAVTVDGDLWEVRLTSDTEWFGPAFTAPSPSNATANGTS